MDRLPSDKTLTELANGWPMANSVRTGTRREMLSFFGDK